jgi:hypothetical protein
MSKLAVKRALMAWALARLFNADTTKQLLWRLRKLDQLLPRLAGTRGHRSVPPDREEAV